MLRKEDAMEECLLALGKPYFHGENCAIYCADCLPSLKSLPEGIINLTVTSPPYNIGKEYESTLPIEEYLSWCDQWIAEVHRTTTSAGAFWLNVGYVALEGRAKPIPLPYLLWRTSPFYLIQEIVWNYGAGVSARKSLSPRNEK